MEVMCPRMLDVHNSTNTKYHKHLLILLTEIQKLDLYLSYVEVFCS